MNNFLSSLGARAIRTVIGLVVLVVAGGIFYLFSAQGGADGVYEDLKVNVETSAQIHTIAWTDGDTETYYINEDNDRGYVYDYASLQAVLNCTEGAMTYVESGIDYSDEVEVVEAACAETNVNSQANYDGTFKLFFSGSYDADYAKHDDYYEVTGEYDTGGSYSIKLYKDAKLATWSDADKVYTIEIKDSIELPTS